MSPNPFFGNLLAVGRPLPAPLRAGRRIRSQAADIDGNGIVPPDTHPVCYELRSTGAAPTRDTLYSSNLFGQDSVTVFAARERCVPSTAP